MQNCYQVHSLFTFVFLREIRDDGNVPIMLFVPIIMLELFISKMPNSCKFKEVSPAMFREVHACWNTQLC